MADDQTWGATVTADVPHLIKIYKMFQLLWLAATIENDSMNCLHSGQHTTLRSSHNQITSPFANHELEKTWLPALTLYLQLFCFV